eukprot:m.779299 g.779299  ORF g.779299 m.779299 type:complete len:424 (+) comp23278_c0_seq14:274-1545(+)
MCDDEPSTTARILARKVLSKTLSRDNGVLDSSTPAARHLQATPVVHTHIHFSGSYHSPTRSVPLTIPFQNGHGVNIPVLDGSTGETSRISANRTELLDRSIARTATKIEHLDRELNAQSQVLEACRVSMQTSVRASSVPLRPSSAPTRSPTHEISSSIARSIDSFPTNPFRRDQISIQPHTMYRKAFSSGNLLDQSQKSLAAASFWNRGISPYRTLGNSQDCGVNSSLERSLEKSTGMRRPPQEFDPRCVTCATLYADRCSECNATKRMLGVTSTANPPRINVSSRLAHHGYNGTLSLPRQETSGPLHLETRSDAGDSVVSFDETCEKCAEENLWCDQCRAFALEYDPSKLHAAEQERHWTGKSSLLHSSGRSGAHDASFGGSGYTGPCRFGLHHKCYRRSGYLHCPSCGEELDATVGEFTRA